MVGRQKDRKAGCGRKEVTRGDTSSGSRMRKESGKQKAESRKRKCHHGAGWKGLKISRVLPSGDKAMDGLSVRRAGGLEG